MIQVEEEEDGFTKNLVLDGEIQEQDEDEIVDENGQPKNEGEVNDDQV